MRRPPRLPLEQLAPYVVATSPPPVAGAVTSDTPRLDWRQVFGNGHPVELEIGCGKGGFLVAAALDRPAHNFLGLEIDRALYFYIAGRLARRNLSNARVACADARVFLRDQVADASVAAIHVYFPDPWWKKRHHKRRIWNLAFAKECVRVLAPGRRLHVATDVPDTAESIRALLAEEPGLRIVHALEQTGPPADDEFLTNFERKGRSRGGTIWRAEYERQ